MSAFKFKSYPFMALLMMALLLSACGDATTTQVAAKNAQIQVHVPGLQKLSARSAERVGVPAEVTSILIEVLDSKQTVLASAEVVGTDGNVTLSIKEGTNYTVRGTAKAGDELLFQGETAVAKIVAGSKAQVNLTLQDKVQLQVTAPSTVSAGGQAEQFAVNLTGLKNKNINWYVNDVKGGSATLGFVDSTGKYTPPATVNSDTVITIKAEPVVSPSFAKTFSFTLKAIQVSADSDGDGLLDSVETNTGIYVSTSDTGSDPNVKDSDGDGFGDGEEVLYLFSDPNDSVSVPVTSRLKIVGLKSSNNPVVNADGTVVVFDSVSSSTTPVDQNGAGRTLFLKRGADLFILNRDESGNQPADLYDLFGTPSVDDAGIKVAFESKNSLTSKDATPFGKDIYVRDITTSKTILVSSDSSGNGGNSSSSHPDISGNGRYVAFTSFASNLVANDTNNSLDIFVKDLQTGKTVRVSVDSDGNQASWNSYDPVISYDGRYIAFTSVGKLSTSDVNARTDIFRHDRDSDGNGIFDELGGTSTILVSVPSDPITQSGGANGDSSVATMSNDGNRIAFQSLATNLTSASLNNLTPFIYIRDVNAQTTELVSVDKAGTKPRNTPSYLTSSGISGDGRYVVFHSDSFEFSLADLSRGDDVFLKDTLTGSLSILSVPDSAASGVGPTLYRATSSKAAISANGHYVVFYSTADNLVATDNNGAEDVFLAFAHTDSDGDRLSDYEEFLAGSDKSLKDTDGDGVYDGAEVAWELDPTNPNDGPVDLSTNIINDFESDDGGMTATGLWQYGTPTFGPASAFSGNNVWGTNLVGQYAENQTDFLIFPAFKNTGAVTPQLSFQYYIDAYGYEEDYAYADISLDKGKIYSYWTPLNNYPDCCDSGDDVKVWETQNPNYAPVFFDLTGKYFEGQIVQFRIRMESNAAHLVGGYPGGNYAGMYIDNIRIGNLGE